MKKADDGTAHISTRTDPLKPYLDPMIKLENGNQLRCLVGPMGLNFLSWTSSKDIKTLFGGCCCRIIVETYQSHMGVLNVLVSAKTMKICKNGQVRPVDGVRKPVQTKTKL